jgi:hypothetical protein
MRYIIRRLFAFQPCHALLVVYYSAIKRELNRRLIYECRCDEREKLRLADKKKGK